MVNPYNPFTPNDPRFTELYNKSKLIKKDVERLKDELKRKTQYFIELNESQIATLEKKINDLKAKCTHRFPDGKIACSSTHDDITERQPDGSYKKLSFCEICGMRFHNGYLKIDNAMLRKTLGLDIGHMFAEDSDGDDDEDGNITFDPNWQPENGGVVGVYRRGNQQPIEITVDEFFDDLDLDGFDLDDEDDTELDQW